MRGLKWGSSLYSQKQLTHQKVVSAKYKHPLAEKTVLEECLSKSILKQQMAHIHKHQYVSLNVNLCLKWQVNKLMNEKGNQFTEQSKCS